VGCPNSKISATADKISHALEQEEKEVKYQDHLYWEPLKRELEYLSVKSAKEGKLTRELPSLLIETRNRRTLPT